MELPARIGKYELLEFLGGGMSHVYRARDTAIGRQVAIKILTPEACQDPEAKARFLQEARMAGNIEHDHIIRIFDYGEEQGRPFIVMEFLVGEDLRHAIRDNHAGDISNRLRIALDIARALEYIHSRKIIHRDIKPDNVHIDASGKVKLMDFGIAKAEGLHLTRTGFAVGTPYYMSPEQVRGEPATESMDIYAFGILLFELLTGQKPVEGDTLERLFYAILNEPLKPEPMVRAGVPAPVVDLVLRCTAKKPDGRPGSFAEVAAELERFTGKEAAPAARPVRPVARRPMALIGVVVAAVLLAGAAAVYFVTRGSTKPPAPITSTAPVKKELPAVLETATGQMVLVPAGAFLAGADRHSETLPAFYIDRTEVPNSAYERFCQAKQRPLPPGFAADHPDYPVVGITFVDAQEFAKWAGKRLPTALEWEKAARGADGRSYPWGNDADPSRANVADTKPAGPMPVSAFAAAESPFRTLNMTGNVWEFVDDLKTPSAQAVRSFAAILKPPPTATEPWYVIRGGSFTRPLADGVVYEWTSIPARFSAPDIGFRCAKNAE
ncbi:MAG: bifunctional serine/threonine-protein kinase/formylglycine-generating enzyme family protein [Bryobacteraceae bacterium]|jgi:serine/threonine-protein kinase